MYYNEHDKIKSYDLTKTDGVTPLVYYLPKSKFDYELTFENPEPVSYTHLLILFLMQWSCVGSERIRRERGI